ncbi:hypothetical protein [Mycoplasma zalophidermidis]|uniref:hypothetical protein n=1 Tax=Mycoplasma zalophidermidis TaxID=398174 RepID=UPI00215BD756|nr:hypothetical protein [Mycoplasma zalophidermidis]MCR8966700.1 hypothetical protein [Mycoplasma zalophidermidis]
MSENKKKNKRKALATWLIAGIPALALGITVPLLHSKADLYVKDIQTVAYTQLNDVTKNAESLLKTDSVESWSQESKEKLRIAVNSSKQLIANRVKDQTNDSRSAIINMLDSRNSLQSLIPTLKLTEAKTDQEIKQAIKEFSLLIKSPDLLNDFNNAVKKLTKNKNNQEFIKEFARIYKLQNKIVFDLELKTNVFVLDIIANNDNLHLAKKVDKVTKTIDFINTRLAQNVISRDNVETLSQLFDMQSAKLYDAETINNQQQVDRILSQIIEAKKQVSAFNLELSTKDKIYAELDMVELFVQKNKGHLNFNVVNLSDDTHVEMGQILSDYVSSITNRTATYFLSGEELKGYIEEVINEGKKILDKIEPQFKLALETSLKAAQKFIDGQDRTDSHKAISILAKQINSIRIANRVLLDAKKTIKHNLSDDEELSNQLNADVDQLVYNDFFKYVSQLNDIIAIVETTKEIKDFYQQKYTELNQQIEFSTGSDLSRVSIVKDSNKINVLTETNKKLLSVDFKTANLNTIADNYEKAVEVERIINKEELSILLSQIQEQIDKDTISPELKKLWSQEKPLFEKLVKVNSTAMRGEMAAFTSEQIGPNNLNIIDGGLVKFALDLRDKSIISNEANVVINKTKETLAKINESWNQQGSPVEKQLSEHVIKIANEIELLQTNDKLTFEQKQQRINELSELQDVYAQKITEAKDLEKTRDEASNILEVVKDNDNVKIYLAEELKKLSTLKQQADQALNDPTQHNLPEIQEKLKKAVEDFSIKRSNLEAQNASGVISKLLDDTFAKNRKPGEEFTPAEAKMRDALNKLIEKAKVINDDRTHYDSELDKKDARQELANQMDVLRDAIEVVSEMELSLQKLIIEHKQSRDVALSLKSDAEKDSLFKTEQAKKDIKAIADELSSSNEDISVQIEELQDIINNVMFNPDEHNRGWINMKNRDIDDLTNQIKQNVAKAKLKKEQLILNNHKIASSEIGPDQITSDPYSMLIEDINIFESEKNKALLQLEEVNNEIKSLNTEIAEKQVKLDHLYQEKLNIKDDRQTYNQSQIVTAEEKIAQNNKQIKLLSDEIKTLQQKVADIYQTSSLYADSVAAKLADQQKLLAKIKECAIEFSKISETEYPELRTNFKGVINNSRAVISDKPNKINDKILALEEMLAKIETSKEAKIELDKLIQIEKNQHNSPVNNKNKRVIFAKIDSEIKEKIAAEQVKLADPSSTKADLEAVKGRVKLYVDQYSVAKLKIVADFNNIKNSVAGSLKSLLNKEKEQKFDTLVEDESATINNGSQIQRLKAKFDALISTKSPDEGGPSAHDRAIMEDFENIRKQFDICFQKDSFKNEKALLEAKVNILQNAIKSDPALIIINGQNPESLIEKINTIINSIDNVVNGVNKPEEVIEQKRRIESMKLLLDEQKTVVYRIKKVADQQDKRTVLEKALIESVPSESALVTDIDNATIALHNQYMDSTSFEELKANESERIDAVKTEFENKYKSNQHDAESLEAITGAQGLIKKYQEELKNVPNTGNKDKDNASILEIDSKIAIIRNNIDNILDLAEVVRSVEEEVKSINETTGPVIDVVNSIKQELEKEFLQAREAYKDPSQFSKLTNIKQTIKATLRKLNKTDSLNKNMMQLKTLVQGATYKLGLNGEQDLELKQTKTRSYYEKLEQFAKDPLINSDTTKIQSLDSVVVKFKELVEKQLKLLEEYNKEDWLFNNQVYGYKIDKLNLGQSVLDSVVSVPEDTFDSTALSNDITIKFKTLPENFKKAKELYEARKEAFEALKKAYDDEGTYITNNYKNVSSATFSELNNDRKIFYVEKLGEISNVKSTDDLEKIKKLKDEALTAHSLFSKYVELAIIVDEARKEVTSAKAESNPSQDLTELLDKITNEVEEINKTGATTVKNNFYFKEINSFNVQTKTKQIKTDTVKIHLLISHSKKLNELKANIDLSEDEKTPLSAILNAMIVELKSKDSIDIQGLKILEEKYLIKGINSFDVSLKNSINLRKAIDEVKSFVPTTVDVDYRNTETDAMKALYTELDSLIDSSTTNLNNVSHNENDKLASIYYLTNTTEGIIAKLKSQKQTETRLLKSEIDDVKSYLTDSYNQTETPLMTDFTNKAVNVIDDNPTLDTLENIKTTQNNLVSAKTVLETQKQAIIKYEKNRLTLAVERLQAYVNLLTGKSVSAKGQTETLNSAEAQKLAVSLGLDKLLNDYQNNVVEAMNVLSSVDNNFKTYSKSLKKSFNTLDKNYTTVKDLSRKSAELLKNQIDSFNAQLQPSIIQNTKTLRDYIDILDKKVNNNNDKHSSLMAAVSKVGTSKDQINSDLTKLETKQLTINYNQDINEQVKQPIQDEFDQYFEITRAILNTLKDIDLLIYGSTNEIKNAKNNTDTLIGLYSEFIKGRELTHMLELIAGANNRENNKTTNKEFANLINSYKIDYDSLLTQQSISNDLLTDAQLALNTKQSALTNIFKPSVALYGWMHNPSNKNFMFDYINAQNSENMKNIKPKKNILLEDFVEKINKIQNQNTSLEVDITKNQEVLDLFKTFNILKGVTPYNLDNVKVFLTRTSTSDPWLPVFLQTDTSIKKTKINLKVVYNQPQNSTNFFNDVTSMSLTFNDIWVTFNTQSFMRIQKDNLGSEDKGRAENNNHQRNTIIFEASRAGWNNKTMNTNIMAAVNKGAGKYLTKNNMSFFTEDVTFDDEHWDDAMFDRLSKHSNPNHLKVEDIEKVDRNIDISNSTENMKFKIRLKDSGVEMGGTTWKHASLSNGKKIMFWIQSGSDLEWVGNGYTNWMPYGITIPVYEEGTGRYGVLHGWEETVIYNSWEGNDASYKNNFEMYWEVYLPKGDKVDLEIKYPGRDVQFYANKFAERFAGLFTDKGNRASRSGSFTSSDKLGWKSMNEPTSIRGIDKYDFFLRLHEDKGDE